MQSLGGRYLTACDVGTYARTWTSSPARVDYVTGRTVEHGGAGDSSVLTAFGVFQGMRAAAEIVWGSPDAGRPPGRCRRSREGRALPGDHLLDDGAEVVITDVYEPAVGRVRAEPSRGRGRADTDELVASDIDVYAPCALGDAINDDTVQMLKARIICGAANNQLAHPGIEDVLESRGILYAPDYCVNAGGLVQVADELEGFSFERAKARASMIYETTRRVFEVAAAEGVPTAVAADRIAERRMADVGRLRGIWLPAEVPVRAPASRGGTVIDRDGYDAGLPTVGLPTRRGLPVEVGVGIVVDRPSRSRGSLDPSDSTSPCSSRCNSVKSVLNSRYFSSRATFVCFAFARPRPIGSTPSHIGRVRLGDCPVSHLFFVRTTIPVTHPIPTAVPSALHLVSIRGCHSTVPAAARGPSAPVVVNQLDAAPGRVAADDLAAHPRGDAAAGAAYRRQRRRWSRATTATMPDAHVERALEVVAPQRTRARRPGRRSAAAPGRPVDGAPRPARAAPGRGCARQPAAGDVRHRVGRRPRASSRQALA